MFRTVEFRSGPFSCFRKYGSICDGNNALYQQWYEAMSFNELIKELGAEITTEKAEADFDFSLESWKR
jgi:hypothetical protein